MVSYGLALTMTLFTVKALHKKGRVSPIIVYCREISVTSLQTQTL